MSGVRQFGEGKCPHCDYNPRNITACNAKRHLQMVHPEVFRRLSAIEAAEAARPKPKRPAAPPPPKVEAKAEKSARLEAKSESPLDDEANDRDDEEEAAEDEQEDEEEAAEPSPFEAEKDEREDEEEKPSASKEVPADPPAVSTNSTNSLPQLSAADSALLLNYLNALPSMSNGTPPAAKGRRDAADEKPNGFADVKNENAQLVADLMRQFYRLGWVFGSGGAMCVRTDEGSVFVTPSAVQKDRLNAEDIGVYDRHHQLVIAPSKPHVVSSCVNLFWTIFRTNDKQIPNRPLNSVIHTHSIEANLMASFPLPSGLKYDHVRLSNEEMLKGIVDRACGSMLTNTQTCIIPVIENSPSEGCPEFKERIERAMLEHPGCSAILVRNHGAFYFGYSWQDTKIMAEIFEYLFKLTLEKIKFAPQLAERVFRSSEASK
ncbi:putative methylthioribulose-1-phosphate dehydratase [Aphelenchoides fujianensis]|nr:putative methylthioribulose-1-phosphate dehydratase [Aphelenchoides fujianensis]